jgi:hypothetical protein
MDTNESKNWYVESWLQVLHLHFSYIYLLHCDRFPNVE